MSRQAKSFERRLFEVVRSFNHRFYYKNISSIIDEDGYKITIDKSEEEMVGRALVVFDNGTKMDYELRYNRIVNLSEGYTILVPGLKPEQF
jgi:hypothetical protein